MSTVTEHRKQAARTTAAASEPAAEAGETPYACTRCGQDFVAGEWFCADGQRHVVAERTYLLNDAPQQSGYGASGQLPKHGRTIITNIPPPDLSNWQPGADDEHLGGSVTFVDGRFSTTDPEQIYWLDLRGGYCSEAEWEAGWLSPEELERLRQERAERDLAAREEELKQLRQQLGLSKEGST